MILSLLQNYIPSYQWVVKGGWNIADCVSRFDVKLHYTNRHRLSSAVKKELNLAYQSEVESMVKICDVVTINPQHHPETEHLFDESMIVKMKRCAYLINTPRGKICDRDAVAKVLESGQLASYAGDVWFPQPAPQDHIPGARCRTTG